MCLHSREEEDRQGELNRIREGRLLGDVEVGSRTCEDCLPVSLMMQKKEFNTALSRPETSVRMEERGEFAAWECLVREWDG